jgi:mono/diheme cytochrome c family protein
VRIAILSLLAAFALIGAGCGAVKRVSSGDPSTGKQLFIAKCGACHVLANAKTQGLTGPNLDDAFGPSKEQGFKETTIADVVRGQIAYPDTDPSTGVPGMPPNLLHGQEARDVAVYVAQCSATPNCDVAKGTVKLPA